MRLDDDRANPLVLEAPAARTTSAHTRVAFVLYASHLLQCVQARLAALCAHLFPRRYAPLDDDEDPAPPDRFLRTSSSESARERSVARHSTKRRGRVWFDD